METVFVHLLINDDRDGCRVRCRNRAAERLNAAVDDIELVDESVVGGDLCTIWRKRAPAQP